MSLYDQTDPYTEYARSGHHRCESCHREIRDIGHADDLCRDCQAETLRQAGFKAGLAGDRIDCSGCGRSYPWPVMVQAFCRGEHVVLCPLCKTRGER